MLFIVIVMAVIVVLAVLVVTYVAYPHRGEPLPAAPWLGEAMARAVDAAPTLDPVDAPDYRPQPEDAERRG